MKETKKILLLGDVIHDFNLMEYPPTPSLSYQALPKTTQIETEGGVLHLRNLITNIMPDETVELQCPGNASEENDVKVYNIWKQVLQNTKDKTKVWRIDHIIGRTEPDKEALRKDIEAYVENAPQTNILVIDDLGLGWVAALMAEKSSQDKEKKENTASEGAKAPQLVEKLLEKTSPEHIILKLSSLNRGLPFAKDPDYRDKMTVIMDAHTLRGRGAAISEGLSWDQTIEDTVREFEKGLSSLDLALCQRCVVLFNAEGIALFERDIKSSKFRMEKFLYHPSEYEGSFKAKYTGKMSGNLSLVTAAMIRHLVLGEQYPVFVALSLALTAMRKQYEDGIPEDKKSKEPVKRTTFVKQTKTLSDILAFTDCLLPKAVSTDGDKDAEKKLEERKNKLAEYLRTFSCAFRHDLLEYGPQKYDAGKSRQPTEEAPWKSNLLRDATGYTTEYVAAKAFQIIMQGTKDSLSHMPVASYKLYLTADREEIERINAIRKLIIAYRENSKDKKPLSIAVFGPPGSGKSFSIKQLAEELGFAEKSIHTFNLSEFKKPEELHVAFHIVRDATIKGEIPLIFWDEFDSDKLNWLKDFLAPMQDAEFRAGSVIHPLGKAVFVFAGGVFSTFEEFEEETKDEKKNDQDKGNDAEAADNKNLKESETKDQYKGKKSTDFISRLRGYVNVKGPNPQKGADEHGEHLIRRALLLRSVLERTYPQLLASGGQMCISAPVAQAFLRVDKYKHGARSLESIVTMSNLVKASFFGEAALPPDHLLNLHVNAENFKDLMRQATLDAPMLEMIAEAYHNNWKKQKEEAGYKFGNKRSDVPPKFHHQLVKYAELDEKGKENNRSTARVAPAKLQDAGLEIVPPEPGQTATGKDLFDEKQKEHLIKIEHDIWMREYLMQGCEHSEITVDALKLHRSVQRFDKLSEEDQKLDKALVEALGKVLEARGYGVMSKPVKVDEEKKVF